MNFYYIHSSKMHFLLIIIYSLSYNIIFSNYIHNYTIVLLWENNVVLEICKRESKLIDSVIVSKRIIELIEGSKIIDFNIVIITDYRGVVIDINFENYFEIKKSTYNI